jgi:hypothetical protein
MDRTGPPYMGCDAGKCKQNRTSLAKSQRRSWPRGCLGRREPNRPFCDRAQHFSKTLGAIGQTMEVERLSSNLRKTRGSFGGSCKSLVPRAHDSPQFTAFLGFDTPRMACLACFRSTPNYGAVLAQRNSLLCADGDTPGTTKDKTS